jgi:parvulin-like peptidyl-prolyl isomerase
MKFKLLASAALMAGVFTLPAATSPGTPDLNAATNANPQAAMTALFGDPVVVKAKGYEIKRSELDQVVSTARANQVAANQQVSPDLDILALEQLMTIQTLLQKATPADVIAGKLDADQQYTNLVAKFRSAEEFERLLKAKNLTVADLRSKAEQEATAKAVVKRELNISVTDQAARDFYNQHAADFEEPEQVHAEHILLMTIDPSARPPLPLSTNTVAAKRKQIEDLRKRILAGEDFATLAKQYSEDTGSKVNGGELPNFSRGQMVPEFEAAAFSLGTNQVSEVVTTQYGYHLIKVLEKIPAKKVEFATAESDIKDMLAQTQIRKRLPAFVLKQRTEQQVQILDDALKAKDEQVQANQAAAETEAAADKAAADSGTAAPAAGTK